MSTCQHSIQKHTNTHSPLCPNLCPVSSSGSPDITFKRRNHTVLTLSSPSSRLSTTFSHPMLSDSLSLRVCVSQQGAFLPPITWNWVNWVTLITSQPRISQRPAALVERNSGLVTARHLHNPWPCWCVCACVCVCDSEGKWERETCRHGVREWVRERLLMWEWGCV